MLMEYNIKKIKEITKKEYNTCMFASEFSVDEDGYMYIYTTDDTISRIGTNKSVEDFILPDRLLSTDMDYPRHAPIILEARLFHVRYGKGFAYILITDMNLNELTKVDLKGNPYIRTIFESDNHFFFTTEFIYPGAAKPSLCKMTSEGKMCWEYKPSEGEIFCHKVTALNDGKILTPISIKCGTLNKCHIIDRNGNLDSVVDNIMLDYPPPQILNSNVMKDNRGNICIHTVYPPIYENGQEIEKYKFHTVILNQDGQECYRKSSHLWITRPALFHNYSNIFSAGLDFGDEKLMKTDILDETQKIIVDSNDFILLLSAYHFEEKIIMCYGDEKKSIVYCLDHEYNILWTKSFKGWAPFLALKNNFLYAVSKDKIGIYQIVDMDELQ
jgi:hypothetical protein